MARRPKRAQPQAPRRRRPARTGQVGKARGGKRQDPFTKALRAVADFVEKSEYPATIIGGVAVIAHGFARATADIDVALLADAAALPNTLKIAASSGLRPRVKDALRFAQENLVLLLEDTVSAVPVDVSLAMQPFEANAMRRREMRNVAGIRVPVCPLETLLIYKMVAGRPKDFDDVKALLATGVPFDRGQVENALVEIDAVLDSSALAEFRRLMKLDS